MRQILLVFVSLLTILSSCKSDNPLDRPLQKRSDFIAAAKSFSAGEARNGRHYFFGVLSHVVEIDVSMHSIQEMDHENVPVDQIQKVLDSTLMQIANARNALNLYHQKEWKKRADFHAITFEWLEAVEKLIRNHLIPLAEPLSRADDTWTADEIKRYDAYLGAYEEFLLLDKRWVAFQYEYVEANNFTLSDQAISIDELTGETANSDQADKQD